MIKLIVTAIVILAAGYAGWLFLGVSGGLLSKKSPLVLTEEAMTLRGVRLTQKMKNKEDLELVAETASVALDESRIDMENFTVVSYSGEYGTVIITARRGTLKNPEKDIYATGGVLARDGSGNALITENAQWINASREIHTDDQVRVFGERFTLTGKGMTAKMDDKTVEILNDVNAVFFPENK
ncbi:MAG: LPS export ABC transporter periplasmic protein LptC [Nitrospinae bacterium]|nr:LPS export ABC transporter periplasmic protein LptC [Nitrospinota bacterium]